MNILKSVSMSAYYQIRRISKAFKNWKKFGVIMFGSLFLAANTVPAAFAAQGELEYLYIDPAAISVQAGKTYQFTYRATDNMGTPVSVNPVWSMAKPEAGTVSNTGLFTAGSTTGTFTNAVKLNAGVMSVYARITVLSGSDNGGGTGGNGGSGSGGTTDGTQQKLTHLYVDPSAISVELGHSYTFKARAYDQNWLPMTVPTTWSVAKSEAGSIDQTGKFTAGQNKGTYENAVKLQSGSLTAYARVVVYGDTTPSTPVCKVFRLEPQNSRLTLSSSTHTATQDFQLVVEDENGDTNVDLTNIAWAPADKMIVTGARTARLTVTQTGNLMVGVTAKCNGIVNTDTTEVTVIDNAPDFTVRITPDMPRVLSGTPITYTATAVDANGQVIDPATKPITFVWSLVDSGPSLGRLLNTTGKDVVFQSNTGLNGDYYNFLRVVATYQGLQRSDLEGASFYQVGTQQVLDHVIMTVDRNPIYTNDSTPVRAQAYDQFNQPIANCAYNWNQLSGVGGIISATNQQVITFGSQNIVGNAELQVTANCFGANRSTTGTVQVIGSNNNFRVELTPDPAYVAPNSDVNFTARGYSNNVDVTGSTSFSYTMLNTTAGYIVSQSGNTVRVHTGNNLGTFASAIQTTGYYQSMTATDTATIVIAQNTPIYTINGSVVGALDGRGTNVCTDDMITYTVTVSNFQNNTLTNVSGKMAIPANTTFVSATSATGYVEVTSGVIKWTIGSLANSQSVTMTVKVMPKTGLTGSRTINATFDAVSDQVANTFNANPINLVCGGATTDGKGPLPSTGVEWQMLVALLAGALGLTTVTYLVLRRKDMAVERI